MSRTPQHRQRILLTGASGYIGGRLLRPLEATGHQIRCLDRDPASLTPRVTPSTEVIRGDLLDAASLAEPLAGVDIAYYLVHSLGAAGPFQEMDRQAAENFATAARDAGVRRIIFLGGLGEEGPKLSAHLASRHEVGDILRSSGVQTIEFRASIIIGSGSISFELVRNLVDKLPVLIVPRWIEQCAQPLAVEDVIAYLVAAAHVHVEGNALFQIGGADQASYGGIIREYARQRRLRRLIIPLPFLPPRFFSFWLPLLTPLYARVGRHLVDGMRNATCVTSDAALRLFPVKPRGTAEAVARALGNEDEEFAATRWSDATFELKRSHRWGGAKFGPRFVDSRTVRVPFPPSDAFAPITCIGGERGWYAHNWLWGLRGMIDQVLGGVGLRRGRRDPACVLPGETLDFWRVEAVEPDRLLRLFAEMRLPGRAWLQFEVESDASGSTLRQTAMFDPLGIGGRLYWYGFYLVHQLVLGGLLRGVVREAHALRESGAGGPSD